jgi:hypothetical protein
MSRENTEPAAEQQYDLHYVSQLTPEEIRVRVIEKTVPYHPRKVRKSPWLLHHQEDGDFYFVSTGHHYFFTACGIALLHLEPLPDSGNTVIVGLWKKKVPMKLSAWNILPLILLATLLALLQFIFPLNVHDTILVYLSSIAGGLSVTAITHFNSPPYQQQEQRNLRNFIEENLLE